MPPSQSKTARGDASTKKQGVADPGVRRNAGTSERASDSIVANLEEQIVSGALAEGAPLPAERDLMERFGASRTVVREAITALSTRGLIENRPRFRPIVRKPDFTAAVGAMSGVMHHLLSGGTGVKSLYDSRIFIERALAREAAISARKKDIDALRTALRDNEAAIGNSEQFYATDVAFHRVMYTIPRNPVFPAVHQAYSTWLTPYWEKMLRSRERDLINYQSHKAIFEAILDRDPDAADEALRNHLNAAWEYVRVTFDADDL